MKKLIKIISLLLLSIPSFCQITGEMEFVLNTEYNEDKCKPLSPALRAHLENSELYLLNDNKFIAFSFDAKNGNPWDSAFLYGRYRNQGDTLILYSIRNFDLKPAKKITPAGQASLDKKYPDVNFEIGKCANGEIMLTSVVRGREYYGLRPKPKEEKYEIAKLKQDSKIKALLQQ